MPYEAVRGLPSHDYTNGNIQCGVETISNDAVLTCHILVNDIGCSKLSIDVSVSSINASAFASFVQVVFTDNISVGVDEIRPIFPPSI